MVINLPYNFKPRHYQCGRYRAHFVDKKKRVIEIIHRRAGKTKNNINFIVVAALSDIGNYWYLMPTITQARTVIWNGVDREGHPYLDHIPKKLIKSVNNVDMLISLVNGSTIQFLGSENYNRLMSGNPKGVIFDEYPLQSPYAWDYIRPILTENEGWAHFTYTPRGTNHGWDLYNTNRNNDKWYVNLLTVDQTYRQDGEHVISKEKIEDERTAGMSDDMIEQEFYCSFSAAVKGAYFSKQLASAEADNRICEFPIDPSVAVDTYWDLGIDDSTAIWLIQKFPREYVAIGYYENFGSGIDHYINWLHDYRGKKGIVFGAHYGPHDVNTKHFSTGKSTLQIARELGFNFTVVPRIKQKGDAINVARMIFPKVTFHATNCAQGISCLREYHRAYDEKRQVLSMSPLHNWASHGADAFMTFAQTHQYGRSETGMVLKNVIGSPAYR